MASSLLHWGVWRGGWFGPTRSQPLWHTALWDIARASHVKPQLRRFEEVLSPDVNPEVVKTVVNQWIKVDLLRIIWTMAPQDMSMDDRGWAAPQSLGAFSHSAGTARAQRQLLR